MATQANDEAFLQKYGNYKPAPANVPVSTIKPIIGGETPEQAAARRAEEERKAAEEARKAAAAERERIRFEEEQKAGGAAKPTEAQQKTLTLLTRIAGGNEAIKREIAINPEAQEAGLGETIVRNVLGEGLISRAISGESRRIVVDSQADILDGLLTLGTGAAYTPDQLRSQTIAYFPQYGDTDREIQEKNRRLDTLIQSARIQAGPLADRFDEVIKPLIGAAPSAQAEEAAPGAAPAPAPTVAPIEAGKPFQTEADLAAQRQLQDAWNRGLSVDDMINLNQQMGRGPFAPEDIARMRDARAKGGPISFYATPTGQPTAAQGIIGAALETPVGEAVGGYAMGAANALTAGTLDELAPILGLDPARVQAAKDYLRERAPVSSLAGEVTGGILGSIPAVRGAGAALAGTRLAGAAPLIGEAVYGAAYGAGEAPEGQRALGALIGGGAAGVGGALANRFLPGGPGTFTGMAPEVPAGAVAPEVPPVAAMAPEMPPVAAAAPSPAPVAPATAAPAPTPEMAAELGTIIRDASGTGSKAKNAQIKLAEMAQINPEAKASAERLGIEVPADVFSDNPQVRAAIGLTRSLAGSEAEAGFRTAVANAVDQADNVMREFDAQFVEGAVSPGTVSQRVKDSLTKTRSDLNAEASAIYKRVDESVPKQTPVQMDNLFRELTAIAGEVGESGMTAQEKRLLGLIQSGEVGGGDITYGRLIREKNLIGKALKREESPYGSLDEATLKRLYAALATDQLDNVGRIGGEELRAELRGANLIYAKERALGERIVNAFGKDLEGGIAGKMRAAITGAAKGEPGDFARLMKAVPADLRKEVVATALTAAARSARGAEKGGFGFSEFADLYPKLRANPQVYKQIVETLGPKASDTLRDLFEVSKRITDARANVLTTGKANQALMESLNAEGILARIMDSTTAKRAVGAMAGLGGPVTGAVMPDIMQAMSKGNPDAVRAAGKMFVSPEFQSLLTEAATQPEVTERAINRAVSSQRFRDFAKTIGLELKQGRNWLRSAITAGSVQEMGPEAGPPEGAIMVRPQQ